MCLTGRDFVDFILMRKQTWSEWLCVHGDRKHGSLLYPSPDLRHQEASALSPQCYLAPPKQEGR